MKTLARLFVFGWVFYSLGYFDEQGRFVLSVQQARFATLDACATARANAQEAGWSVLFTCVRDDEGAVVLESSNPGER